MSRGFNRGRQPDGDYVDMRADGIAFTTTTLLSSNGEYTSDWMDSDGFNTIEIVVNSDVSSSDQGFRVDFTDDTSADTPTVRFSRFYDFNVVDVQKGYKIFRVPTSLDGFRVDYINGVEPQESFFLNTTLRVILQPN